MNATHTHSAHQEKYIFLLLDGTNKRISSTSSSNTSITKKIQNELNQAEIEAQKDGTNVCKESVIGAHNFINEILPKLGIKPSYVDIYPDGKAVLTWHNHPNAISALCFEGNQKIIWNYYLKDTNNKNYGIMSFSNFLSSDVCNFLKKNFC